MEIVDIFFSFLFFHSFLDDRDFLSTIFFVSFVSAGHIDNFFSCLLAHSITLHINFDKFQR